MQPEKQRIAIAEVCGWSGGFIPDYLNDLNAMHEARKSLTNNQHQHYYRALEQITSGLPYDQDGSYGAGWLYHNINATAAQHAEAFLRTLNLWKD